MKTGRKDYDTGIDATGTIPEDEPVFLIRGQDPAGPGAVEAYGSLAFLLGADPELIQKAKDQAKEMRRWQSEHPEAVHPADLPE